MPDWGTVTKELKGKAPRQETSSLWLRFLAGCGRGMITLVGTLLASLGLTALLNPSIRQQLWEMIQKLW
ncbi:hypothetical protein [Hominifimenecus sp. rT4P-3]|uniref:hypothetical protein n=1 Tax=Hominifimenecus sp. rT4P-3 TaxID=3242979 RepID=UPI003DA1E6D3